MTLKCCLCPFLALSQWAEAERAAGHPVPIHDAVTIRGGNALCQMHFDEEVRRYL